QNEQRTAVTPMAFNAPFAVSQNSADASYLQQMALSFIALRLNVSSETLQAPVELSSVADAVWTGNHLKMVRFAVENKTLSALNIRESDFWQPGTRAVMFSQPASQLLAGARMDVYVIRDGEGN
ncbi:TPA: type-F conjugative transfer system secretin TraK, partial [Escherichia coli]|nr:type-F conjugative transfer system secretin TraK [Escherichia coli]